MRSLKNAKKARSSASFIRVASNHAKMVATMRAYQEEMLETLRKDKYMMICWCRRLGKDYMGLYAALKQCSDEPNSLVYYILPTAKQAQLIIAKGKTEEKKDIVTSIVNKKELVLTMKGNVVHSDNTIRFRNGSMIQLHGADSGSLVGTGVDLIVCSEGALFNLADVVEYLIPNTIQVGGRVLIISTPRLGSTFNEMFVEDNIYKKSLINAMDPKAVDINNEPIYTADKLELIKKLMSIEKFNQEYKCDMEQHNELSIYGRSFEIAQYFEGEFVLGGAEKVFVSFDLGGRDLTAMWFAVIRRDKDKKEKLVIFKHYSERGVATKHFIDYINKFIKDNKIYKPNMALLMPHDARNKHDTGKELVSRAAHYIKDGFDVRIQSAVGIAENIEVCRASIQQHDVVFVNNDSVKTGIKSIEWY